MFCFLMCRPRLGNLMLRLWFAIVTLAALTVGAPGLHADERLAGKACRSVHLAYSAGAGVAYYNEVTVETSAPGTYFCACGWNKGYFGIQELGNGKKVVIFSVWDSNQNNPKAVDDDKRVKLLHKDDKVRIGRFGGEGTGGQSFLDFDWKVGATYRFLVTAKIDGKRTEYAGYFREPDAKEWRHLVTFSTVTGGKNMSRLLFIRGGLQTRQGLGDQGPHCHLWQRVVQNGQE